MHRTVNAGDFIRPLSAALARGSRREQVARKIEPLPRHLEWHLHDNRARPPPQFIAHPHKGGNGPFFRHSGLRNPHKFVAKRSSFSTFLTLITASLKAKAINQIWNELHPMVMSFGQLLADRRGKRQ
ncbi:hypothetical protein AVEN_69234-1 [Araneus ventricosus]|uniref:Uncharacterized protein n=1 Tax=Araneus ventricosus TaxID=182803 RepID=A0A4Y2ENW7_ARAVE|nr:hypothetical protein AVEN_69234-1 [Araneus ventricosus]